MDKVWAPWRIKYINRKKIHKCIFCIDNNRQNDKKDYIIKRTKYSFAILNKYPYNNGHTMIVPYKHVKDLDCLTQEELLDLLQLLHKIKTLIIKALKPDGFNIGINLGKVAGAGFADHVHIHIVPRWLGDTNFMPVCSDTKVISQSLSALYKRLMNVNKG